MLQASSTQKSHQRLIILKYNLLIALTQLQVLDFQLAFSYPS